MDFIYELYDSLLWVTKSDGENTYKEPWYTQNEIDEMDIFFWLDYKIYMLKKDNKETIARYDNIGL
ncbi:hypothetical protein [Clostridium pasteurianum]|uniref:Uncharacterized protein n=1 Tax=Clostridium pasteurianum BC1 TaxID=86416 RepID=R4KAZ2_CLOPA|nr:hypothetical protein [Clostridium pasteurianum]AGK96805.1 hypothetical protein Clopa_1905 [Clostridium pasteurianum BC1]